MYSRVRIKAYRSILWGVPLRYLYPERCRNLPHNNPLPLNHHVPLGISFHLSPVKW
jgi:hypothetical protein